MILNEEAKGNLRRLVAETQKKLEELEAKVKALEERVVWHEEQTGHDYDWATARAEEWQRRQK